MKYICGCCKREVYFWQRKTTGLFLGEKFKYHKDCMEALWERIREKAIREFNGGREVE